MSDNTGVQYMCEYTELVPPEKLSHHPSNPNKHPSNQIKALAMSIERLGWRHPIVVSKRSGHIVCGHCRQQAAMQIGCKAPVDYQDFEDEESEIAVLTADNIIPELATMDNQLLAVNRELLLDAGFDLEIIGFEIESDEPEEKEIDEKTAEYKVVIDCRDENHQAEVLQMLEDRGLVCKPLIL